MPKRTAASSKFRKIYRPTRPQALRTLRRAYSSAIAPRQYYVRGRGGYWDNVKSRWAKGGGDYKDEFEKVGSAFGGLPGKHVGGFLNRALYALTGFGDYKVKQNVLLEETNGPPAVVNRSNKEFVVRHREYIQDIYSASGAANTPSIFGIQAFPINPGNSQTFPWLSSVADKFEQYRIEGMVFEFKSLYSDAVVTQNGSIGSTILATEYNAGVPPFSSKQAMENYQFAQSAKPSCSILHPIECANKQNVLSELYIRTATLPTGEDIKTYDFGDFQIASQGIPLGSAGAAVNLGELWVSYQIALIKPKIPSVTGYVDSGFGYFSGVTNNAGLQPFGTNPVPYNSIIKRSTTNFPVNLVSNNTFEIQCLSVPMTYEIEADWHALNVSGTAAWRAPNANLVNGTFVNSTSSGSFQNSYIPNGLTTTMGAHSRMFVNVPVATPSAKVTQVVFQTGTFGADQVNPVWFEIMINAVPSPLTATP